METPFPHCPGYRVRDEQIAALQAEVAALNQKFDELNRRSPPPRPEERYPKAPAKKPTKKKRDA